MMKKRTTIVRIVNPRDGKTHTSLKSALDLIARGAAEMESQNAIRLIDDLGKRREFQSQLLRHRIEESIVSDRGGIIFWDGCCPGRKVQPRMGVVGNNAFPAPDAVFDRAA